MAVGHLQVTVPSKVNIDTLPNTDEEPEVT
jgi:hypothetical protein